MKLSSLAVPPHPAERKYPLNQTKHLFPLIFISLEDDSSIVIPPQPTSPGEIMSGGDGEPVEADVPAEDETVSPQGTHVTGTQTVTHEYLTLNGKVARETIKTNNTLTAVLDFVYDESGKPFALKYSTNGTSFQTYYYVLNLQGDVVKLIHYIPGFEYESVATYEYDAWGNIVSSSGRLAEINPLRYRGYYYDNETGFYYLQSRYYNPAIHRWINSDSLIGQAENIQGTNLFSYCFNNPVNMTDSTGNWPKLSTIFAVVAVAAVAVAAVAVTVATCGAAAPALAVAGGSIAGGISAGSVATGAMLAAGASAAAAATTAVAEKAVEKVTKRNNSVYALIDDSDTVQYVGRTNDIERRRKAHGINPARSGLRMEILASGLNLAEARALEQAGMAYYHTINTANKMNNQINGIAPKYWTAFKELAVGVLDYGWNQMTNEILYWTGN